MLATGAREGSRASAASDAVEPATGGAQNCAPRAVEAHSELRPQESSFPPSRPVLPANHSYDGIPESRSVRFPEPLLMMKTAEWAFGITESVLARLEGRPSTAKGSY